MSDKLFLKLITDGELKNDWIIDISNGGKILIISDIHMGSGTRDDLSENNGEMLIRTLEDYYYKNGWILVL